MAELPAKKRASIPKQKFGLPEKAKSSDAKKETGNYPMPDRKHAANAKSRATQQLKKGNLTKSQHQRIVKKADKILDTD